MAGAGHNGPPGDVLNSSAQSQLKSILERIDVLEFARKAIYNEESEFGGHERDGGQIAKQPMVTACQVASFTGGSWSGGRRCSQRLQPAPKARVL